MTTPLIPKHPESGCFADWFLGDGECFKCSDWITITIGAWSGHGWFEGDKDQIQTIQAHVTYVFTSWKRIENIRCLYEPVCVRTEDLDKARAHLLDKAKAEVIGTFDGVEEISALWIIFKEKSYWRSCWPAMENQNAACSNEYCV